MQLATAKGSSKLAIQAILASPDGIALPIDLQDGQVTVGARGIIQPTGIPTTVPIPTSSPRVTPNLSPTVVSPSTLSPTATVESTPTSTVELLVPPKLSTASVTSTETNLSATVPAPTETVVVQAPESLHTATLSTIPTRVTEMAIATKISTQFATEVMGNLEPNKESLPTPGLIIIVAGIILCVGILGGAIYLGRRKPKN